jgi:hypothetical protein
VCGFTRFHFVREGICLALSVGPTRAGLLRDVECDMLPWRQNSEGFTVVGQHLLINLYQCWELDRPLQSPLLGVVAKLSGTLVWVKFMQATGMLLRWPTNCSS